MKRGELHENFERLEHESSSDTSFGFSFAFLFVLAGGVRLFHGHLDGGLWLVVALGLIVVTLLDPDLLKPANRVWFRFSMILFRFVSPVMMALVYFLVITPFGLVMRMSGRKLLDLDREPKR
ncbi:MAG: SxtJ family membrane protein, partial [Bdellovibrionota bacterium]